MSRITNFRYKTIFHGGRLLSSFFLFFFFNANLHAIYQGSAGEAILVPLVIYDSTLSINTTISITIPDKIGVAQIPNQALAPHTSPTEESLPPAAKKIHWIFYDHQGLRRQDGYFNLTPNAIYTLDWKSTGSIQNGRPGFVLLVTDAGYNGDDADFNIFAEAKLSIGLESTSIPVFGMADGLDSGLTDQSNCLVQGLNEVCKDTPQPSISSQTSYSFSPLSSGILTGKDGETGETVFDLMLGKRVKGYPFFGLIRGTEPTLLVIWNDGLNYTNAMGYVYGSNGEYCSDVIPLNHRLNLVWILPKSTSPQPLIKIPATTYKSLCFPSGGASEIQSQYFTLELPTNPFQSTSVAFSLIMGTDMRMIPARERGRFITEPQLSSTEGPLN
jgi:hypothetical protein